ncbi:alanine racemase [Noviherbaspirillum cavernae]|uniref:Alanine racemase n=1 Tax=Noviherbaspirillum cavernae TaxID=2320862 RepID=A0A418X0Q2_9BURK|nr:alanine racemase [Noviherbaspirillum cavernae]RJG06021.1 alanine racemase [Noviherbaspirillum cavernae]
MPRPITAAIDLAAMRHNLAVAKNRAPGARVWAVVKANAYGHGLERGMRGFSEADGLALIEVEGAVSLREMGWKKPILLLEGFFEFADLNVVAEHDVQVAVHCDEQIAMIERARLAMPIDVHLKMNSGMNRLGFKPDVYRDAYARLRNIPAVRSLTLMTHFANADDTDNPGLPLAEQIRRFQAGAAGLTDERSLFNSAADLMPPDVHTDWVRPGIMLYGGTPGGKSAEEFGLRPAMTLTSEIIGVQSVESGDALGYGSRFIAGKPMKIGVVACGYADGYPRHAPNGTPVIVEGRRTQIVGRVSMDMITVDLSDIPGAAIGSKVILWGEGLPIDEVANAAGTIGYELMCALAPRVRTVERNDARQ